MAGGSLRSTIFSRAMYNTHRDIWGSAIIITSKALLPNDYYYKREMSTELSRLFREAGTIFLGNYFLGVRLEAMTLLRCQWEKNRLLCHYLCAALCTSPFTVRKLMCFVPLSATHRQNFDIFFISYALRL